jgi:mycoredoxin-dependent peroxiredoxin
VPVAAGDPAPDFTLLDQDRRPVTLSALRGAPVLLVFYPFAFSPLCGSELGRLRDSLSSYGGVTVLAVSTDPVYALKAFRAQEGYDFPLLSDFWPHGATASAYGVLDERKGMALRATFLVDADGVVRFAQVNGPGDVREQSEWRDAVARLLG